MSDLLSACKLAYRKYHMGDDLISASEVSDALCSAICNAIGDEAYQVFVDKVEMGIETIYLLDDNFKLAMANDIVENNIVYILGDDDVLHKRRIESVGNPNDLFKGFTAHDGCRYGLDGCYVKKVKE